MTTIETPKKNTVVMGASNGMKINTKVKKSLLACKLIGNATRFQSLTG